MTSQIPIDWCLTDFVPGCVLQILSWDRIGSASDGDLVDVITHELGFTGDAPVYSLRFRLTAGKWSGAPDLAETPLSELIVDARCRGLDAAGKVVISQDSAHAVVGPRTSKVLEASIGVWPVPDAIETIQLDLESPVADRDRVTLTLDLNNGTAHHPADL